MDKSDVKVHENSDTSSVITMKEYASSEYPSSEPPPVSPGFSDIRCNDQKGEWESLQTPFRFIFRRSCPPESWSIHFFFSFFFCEIWREKWNWKLAQEKNKKMNRYRDSGQDDQPFVLENYVKKIQWKELLCLLLPESVRVTNLSTAGRTVLRVRGKNRRYNLPRLAESICPLHSRMQRDIPGSRHPFTFDHPWSMLWSNLNKRK